MRSHFQTQPKATPKPSLTPVRCSHLQRKFACGGAPGIDGECAECRERRFQRGATNEAAPADMPAVMHNVLRSPGRLFDSVAPHLVESRSGHDFRHVRVHPNERFSESAWHANASAPIRESGADFSCISRSGIQNASGGFGKTNYEFDTLNVGLTNKPGCTAAEVQDTNKQAEAGRVAGLPFVAQAYTALGTIMTKDALCAFASNFNTLGDDPAFQTRRLIVARRLNGLAAAMRSSVPYTCQPADDPVCMEGGKTPDVVAYVSDHKPPIKFCPPFRGLANETTLQQAIVIHEFAHLVGGVDDAGGYAFGGVIGTDSMTCDVGIKFKAKGDVLINTADALAGFVMHIGQTAAASAPTPKTGKANPP